MLNYIVTSTFGLEATVKREVSRLGFKDIKVSDGRIDFTGDISAIPKANLRLRSADRVLVVIGEFKAVTFDELFEKTKALPWDCWIPKDGKFTVIGKSVKSTLFSVSDCQSIVKKAVVEKLKIKYKVDYFEETGAEYKIQVGLLKDIATLTIDTTGPGLHKRGYRKNSVIAPLKETLAASLIELSYWNRERLLVDPFCGSGTIPIEACMIAKNIAPGLSRNFVSEDWDCLDKKIWKEMRKECYSEILTDSSPEIYGYDIDPKAIEQAKYNARLAGVDDSVRFEEMAFPGASFESDYGIMISNPPYGERIGNKEEIASLYRQIGKTFKNKPGWSVYVITSNEDFEILYGKKADKKRKLFNGMIRTDYYQFHGEAPAKKR